MKAQELAVQIKNAALQSGYAACGIIKISEMRGYADAIDRRIGHFPHSRPMYERLAAFADPAATVPWAKSIVVCAYWDGKYHMPENLAGLIGKAYCFDSRKDENSQEFMGSAYFEAELKRLGIQYAAKRDFGISAMRWAAAKAGIGIIRKNNFLYIEKGSYCTLFSYVIGHELELKEIPQIKPCPKSCRRCMQACPTGALSEPFQTDGTACISYLLCMGTCAPDKPYYDRCGSWIYGCDACQDACPFNKQALQATEEFPGLAELAQNLSYERIMDMSYDEMRTLLSQKFWYIKPDEVWKWKCNVLNAMTNNYDEKYLPCIEKALMDSQPEVREMARWAYGKVADFCMAGAN